MPTIDCSTAVWCVIFRVHIMCKSLKMKQLPADVDPAGFSGAIAVSWKGTIHGW